MDLSANDSLHCSSVGWITSLLYVSIKSDFNYVRNKPFYRQQLNP